MTASERRQIDVVSVGEVLLDFVAPDADDLAGAVDFVRAAGGGPANVAVGVCRLGGNAAFIGAVGRDPFGDSLAAILRENGVNTEGLIQVAEQSTLAFVARNVGGIPDFLFYRGADAELKPDNVSLDLLARSTFVYVSSMALLTEPSASATMFAVEAGREAGCLVAVDPNLRPGSWPAESAAREAVLPLLRGAQVIKVNDEEARILADTGDLREAMSILADEETLIVVSLGEEGCLWRWQGKQGRVESPSVTVRETTGAGDAFMAALLTHLAAAGFHPSRSTPLDLAELEQAISFACAAGAYACTQLGAMNAQPTREQVDELIRTATRRDDSDRHRGG